MITMEYDGIEYFPVADDPDVLARLRDHERDHPSSIRLGEFAFSLGLRPPDYTDGDVIPAVVTVFPPGDDEGVLVWDLIEDEDHGEEDEWDADDNPWAGVIGVTQRETPDGGAGDAS